MQVPHPTNPDSTPSSELTEIPKFIETTLEKKFYTESLNIPLKDGSNFSFKAHLCKETNPNDEKNIVIFLPGAGDNSQGHLAHIASNTEHTFNSFTFDYPMPINTENTINAVAKLIELLTQTNPDAKIVLHGDSFGGNILWQVLGQLPQEQIEQIKGAIFQRTPLSKNHIGNRLTRVLKNNTERLLRLGLVLRNPNQNPYLSRIALPEEFIQMLQSLPKNFSLPQELTLPPFSVVNLNNDKIVDSTLVFQTLAHHNPNSTHHNLPSSVFATGHEPKNWEELFLANAQIIDRFFESSTPIKF